MSADAPSAGRCAARLVYSDALLGYNFGPEHPLRPRRLQTGLHLMRSLGVLHQSDLLAPEAATDEELQVVHAPEYVAAVRRFATLGGRGDPDLFNYGFGPGDNPAFPNMHHASALVAGGTLELARSITGGAYLHGFNPAGGLHHALRARARDRKSVV